MTFSPLSNLTADISHTTTKHKKDYNTSPSLSSSITNEFENIEKPFADSSPSYTSLQTIVIST